MEDKCKAKQEDPEEYHILKTVNSDCEKQVIFNRLNCQDCIYV